jgi:hypothetical protein
MEPEDEAREGVGLVGLVLLLLFALLMLTT